MSNCQPCSGNCNQGRNCQAPGLAVRLINKAKAWWIGVQIRHIEKQMAEMDQMRKRTVDLISELRSHIGESWSREQVARADIEELKRKLAEIEQ